MLFPLTDIAAFSFTRGYKHYRNMTGCGRIFTIAGTSASYRTLLSSSIVSNIRNISLNTQRCAILNATTLQKLGIPPKPKRPLTPFFKYLNKERSKLTQENPNLNYKEVLQKLGQNWIKFDPKEKDIMQKTYDMELLDYSKQVMIYEQSMTPEQKKKIKEAKDQKSNKADKYKLKKKIEQLGRPRKPATSFIQFLQARKYVRERDGKVDDWMKSMAIEWKEMSAEEKAKYQVEGRKLMQQYKDNLREWEDKMVRLGHIDVVRNRGLIDLKSSKIE